MTPDGASIPLSPHGMFPHRRSLLPCRLGYCSQRSLHDAPMFRALPKVALNGAHQCVCPDSCASSIPNVVNGCSLVTCPKRMSSGPGMRPARALPIHHMSNIVVQFQVPCALLADCTHDNSRGALSAPLLHKIVFGYVLVLALGPRTCPRGGKPFKRFVAHFSGLRAIATLPTMLVVVVPCNISSFRHRTLQCWMACSGDHAPLPAQHVHRLRKGNHRRISRVLGRHVHDVLH